MRHLSKSASLFGIGAFILPLAVLGAAAGAGTASADGPTDVSVEPLPPPPPPQATLRCWTDVARLSRTATEADQWPPRWGTDSEGWHGHWFYTYKRHQYRWHVWEVCEAPTGDINRRPGWFEYRWDNWYLASQYFIRGGR